MRNYVLGTMAVACLLISIRLSVLSAQEKDSAAAHPIPEEALLAPPAFGVTGPLVPRGITPTDSDSALVGEVLGSVNAWKPKLHVMLRIKPPGVNMQSVLQVQPDGTKLRRSVQFASESEFNFVTLHCDDINVEVKSRDDGKNAYSFSSKGKAVMVVGGNNISGDSITSDDGKLTINNAVVEMFNDTTLRSEKMSLELTVYGINVSSAAAANAETEPDLKPLPDPIGETGNTRINR